MPAMEEGADIPDAVRAGLTDELTAGRLREITRAMEIKLQNRRRGLKQSEGYLSLPDAWAQQRLPLEELAAQITTEFGVAATVEAAPDDWMTIAELTTLDGIGLAGTSKFSDFPIGLPDLVQAAREFDANPNVVIQEGVASPVLQDAGDSLYLFRIVATDPARPPASVDEVRDAVRDDLRRLDHYRRLAAETDAMATEAQRDGLLRLALSRGTQVQPRTVVSLANENAVAAAANQGTSIVSTSTSLPIIGVHEETIAAIVDRAQALDVATADLSNVPAAQRTFALPVDDKLAVVVVNMLFHRPLTQESYRRLVSSGGLQLLMVNAELDEGEAILDTFAYEALAERHDFAMLRGDIEEDDATAPDDGDVAAADQG
jgi:hypothetical protein